jgi:hypothetical protein
MWNADAKVFCGERTQSLRKVRRRKPPPISSRSVISENLSPNVVEMTDLCI